MNNNLVEIEDKLINEKYQDCLLRGDADLNNCVNTIHSQIILDLILAYFSQRGFSNAKTIVSKYFICEGLEPNKIVLDEDLDIPLLCEQLQICFLNSGFKIKREAVHRVISKENMIASGAVYTQNAIVENIVDNTLKNVEINHQSRFLDFACGTGRFYQCIVKRLSSLSLSNRQIVTEIVNASDINPIAVNITRLKACSFIDDLTEEDILAIANRIICENALMPLQTNDQLPFNDQPVLYDAIVSNPPYLVLKPSHKTSPELAEDIKRQVYYYRNSGNYHYSIEGMLNLYQLSIERMLHLLKPKGELGVICPSTLFADKSASKLRRHLLCSNKVRHITYYPENAVLFENNVTQATNIFFLQKGGTTDKITITAEGKELSVDVELIKELFGENMEIPFISSLDWRILKRLSKIPKLKTIKQIRNKRGELDLTLNGDFIVSEPTKHKLVRGKMITSNGIDRDTTEYVSELFVNTKSDEYKSFDYGRVRLVGQNICNIDNPQRLVFAFCESTDILGNSCNYLSADIATLKKMKILLSSALLNWRFKITSSNNHINNYELAELPIINLDLIDEERTFQSESELNYYVCELYGLNKTETDYICKL